MAPRLNSRDYTVAWIAVLPIEAEAALKVLDRRHDGFFKSKSKSGDDYIYIPGELNGHNVIVATLPAGQNYGVGAAAALANQIKMRFSNVLFALLVGVAAGLPNLSREKPERYRDIRLGDVLVGVPNKASTGIVQYDLGTNTEDGFQITGRQAEAPAIVRSAIGNMQLLHARPYRRGNMLATYLQSLQETDSEQNFKLPDPSTDQIFECPFYEDQEQEVPREPRDEEERTQVWYGNIGSGNTVMRNSRRRDELRDRHDLIGLEMEAAGTVNILPTGVIRGVCDYGDGHKGQLWKPYAAAVAAVYAKGVLNTIQSRKAPKRKLKEFRPGGLRTLETKITKEDKEVLGSLAFARMGDRRLNIHPPYEGTCHWILSLPEYCAWDAQPRGLLWIKGKPGAGKSTLMSFLYSMIGEKVVSDSTTCLEFFFSARGEVLQHTFLGMLRSLLNQIYYQDPRIRDPVRQVYLRKQATFGQEARAWDWQQEELKSLLEQAILASAEERQLLLFVDALDEAGEDAACAIAQYFHRINDQIISSYKTVKIYISCRPYPIVSMNPGTAISVESYNHRDIEACIKGHINQATSRTVLSACNSSYEHEWNQLANDIVRQANGVFQWVSLILPIITKSIRDGFSSQKARQRIKEVPKELSSVYEYIIRNIIDRENISRSLLLFQWVCFAERSLSAEEIRYALASHDVTLSSDNSKGVRACDTADFVETDESMEIQLKALSGGLLEIVSKSDCETYRSLPSVRSTVYPTVQVGHQTVKEFLVKEGLALLESFATEVSIEVGTEPSWIRTSAEPVGCTQRAHALIYWSCLKYITTEFDDSINPWRGYTHGRRPLLNYAISFMLKHAKRAEHCHRMSLREQLMLLDQIGRKWPKTQYYERLIPELDRRHSMTSLHIAASFQLADLVAYALSTDIDVNERTGGAGFTALHVAALNYDECIMTDLVSAGANIESKTTDGTTPLLIALESYGVSAAQRLLLLGADASAKGRGNRTALRLFLGVDARSDKVRGNRKALMLASYLNNQEIIRLLVEKGADPNTRGEHNKTVLMIASSCCDGAMIRLVLERGADPNAQDANGVTALMIASYHADIKIVQLLLEHMADVNIRSKNGMTALMTASKNDEKEIVRLLLEHKADTNTQNKHGETALIQASRHGNEETVRLLLRHKIDTHARDYLGRNSVEWAFRSGHERILRLLVEHGARTDTESTDDETFASDEAMDGDSPGEVDLYTDSSVDRPFGLHYFRSNMRLT